MTKIKEQDKDIKLLKFLFSYYRRADRELHDAYADHDHDNILEDEKQNIKNVMMTYEAGRLFFEIYGED